MAAVSHLTPRARAADQPRTAPIAPGPLTVQTRPETLPFWTVHATYREHPHAEQT